MASRLRQSAPLPLPSGMQVKSSKRTLIESRLRADELPNSYRRNTQKESAMNEYAESFRRSFVRLYPHRRPLFLSPANECGVRKFICSTVRPTSLSFQREYDLAQCAELVADLFTYLSLDDASCLPDFVPSPSSSLLVRSGDCVDMSLFLCSLLRGNGYDAYVVLGYARTSLVVNDSSKEQCPLLPDLESEARKAELEQQRLHAEEIKRNRYLALIKSHPSHVSHFEQWKSSREVSQSKIQRVPEELSLHKRSAVEDSIRSAQPQSMHAWVLVRKGRRDVNEDVFVESSTGALRVVALSSPPHRLHASNSPYLEVDAIFNEHNYWVNIQPPTSMLRLDLNAPNDWEPILMSRPTPVASDISKEEEKEQVRLNSPASQSINARPLQWLDVPASWVSPIELSRDHCQARFPLGFKARRYDRCLLEKWSPYTESVKGLVQRITLYADSEPDSAVTEIREIYRNRVDRLVSRVTYPSQRLVRSHFAPGLPTGLQSTVFDDERRELNFIPGSRVDGLISRVELIGKKVIERYSSREDRLIYRSLTVDRTAATSAANNATRAKSFFVAVGGGVELPIRKLAERFEPNQALDPEVDVVKRTHFLVDSLIRLDFACVPGALEGSVWLIDKNDKLESVEVEAKSAQSRGFLRRQTRGFMERGRGEEQRMVAKLLATEKEFKVKIKEREVRFAALLHEMSEMNEAGNLMVDVYDRAHAVAKAANQLAAAPESVVHVSGSGNGDENGTSAASLDYLNPFLMGLDQSQPLTRKQAEGVRTACLTALKERLLSRASIIQTHLEDEQSKLVSKQAALKRAAGSGSIEASEEFQQFSQQCLFRIDILLARRTRHEAMALERYAQLEAKLSNDPRLAILGLGSGE